MTERNAVSPPKWFWVVSGLALVWNLMGVAAFVAQVTMSSEAMAALPQAQQDLYSSTPGWATAAFAVAVFAGLLGCVALLMRKAIAAPLFVASLLGVVVQSTHTFFMSNAMEAIGPSAAAIPLTVFLASIALLFMARRSQRNGWIA